MYWDRSGIKRRLLRWTLRYAQRSIPFYRDLFSEVPTNGLRLEDFPVVDKSSLNRNLDAHMNLERFPDFSLTTGGSSGETTFIPVSFQELELAFKFGTGLRPGEYMQADQFAGITLHILREDHGILNDAPHGQPLLRLPLEHEGHGKMIRQLLEEGLRVGGRRIPIVEITGGMSKLRRLTAFLLETDFDLRSSMVQSIVVYGRHLSTTWRERFSDLWGARISDRYGLSEFFYDVPIECEECGAFHFSKTHVEIMAADRATPIRDGDGFLVLTSLYPFARLLPRIRYWTNDVVRIRGRCDSEGGEEGTEFLGRADGCILIPSSSSLKAILTSADIIEALEAIPGITGDESLARDFFSDPNRTFKAPFPMRSPAHCLVTDCAPGKVPTTARLLIEASIELGGRNPESVRDDVFNELSRSNPGFLGDAESLGIKFDVEVLPPDGLREKGFRSQ